MWCLLDSAKHSIPIPFSLPELMALYFSRGMMGVLKDTVFYDSLVTLFEKIKATLPDEYIEYLSRVEKSLAVKVQTTARMAHCAVLSIKSVKRRSSKNSSGSITTP